MEEKLKTYIRLLTKRKTTMEENSKYISHSWPNSKQLSRKNWRCTPDCWLTHNNTTTAGKLKTYIKLLTKHCWQNKHGGKTQDIRQTADQLTTKQRWRENSRHTPDCWPNLKQRWRENPRHTPDCWPTHNKTTMEGKLKTYTRLLAKFKKTMEEKPKTIRELEY